jgi:hypothetical protein
MTTTSNAQEILANLAQFTGDLARYRHPLNPNVIYTPGLLYLAESCQAFWLIDAIASYYGTEQMNAAIKRDPRLEYLQFWDLTVTESRAILTARADSDAVAFIEQAIAFTDFPLDSMEVWAGFDGQFWTLYLPSEH